MKHINEHNWKQELAMLKAEYIAIRHEQKNVGEGLERWKTLNYLLWKEKELDKAIETIENVFVHKQCWIVV